MNRIAIIDDNHEQRETLKRAIEAYLERRESTLEVIDIYPFETEDFQVYIDWINSENILVLIFDERMHNESENGKGPVGYKGNELVSIIRKSFKYIPVFTVTSHIDDDELQEKFGEFEYIVGREDFIDNGANYVDIIIRSSQRYLDENQNELSEYDHLTKLIASGKGKSEDIDRLKALQIKLHIPMNDFSDRETWLKEYEIHIKELEEYKAQLVDRIGSK